VEVYAELAEVSAGGRVLRACRGVTGAEAEKPIPVAEPPPPRSGGVCGEPRMSS